MDLIPKNGTFIEKFQSLNQNEQVEVLKDFIKTLKRVDDFGQDIFTHFEDMYFSLKTEKAKNEVVKVIDNRIKTLKERNKKIDTGIGCVSSLKCLIRNGVTLERNNKLILDLELINYIAN